MANRKEKKIAQKKSLADEYQKYLSSHGYKKDTWTYAQYKKAHPKQRQLARSGVNYKKVKRMG